MNNYVSLPSNEVAEIFRSLRALKASFGIKPNKDTRAVALIGACICEGFDTRAMIVGTLKKLELHHAHVVILLERHCGNDPEHHIWQLGDDQRYRLLAA